MMTTHVNSLTLGIPPADNVRGFFAVRSPPKEGQRQRRLRHQAVPQLIRADEGKSTRSSRGIFNAFGENFIGGVAGFF